MKLRPYQDEAKRCVLKEWEEVCSTLVVKPTGTGKTILFAAIIESIQPRRAMVIAHREELIFQARDRIMQLTGLDCGIEMGDLYVNNSLFGDTPVVISTIQTQNSNRGDRKRMSRFKPTDFGILVIDEAHHATADSYKSLIHYYKHNNPEIKILGVTATPDRADEEALGQVFESVAFDYEILDAIHDGWLVPIEQQFVHIDGLDFSRVKTTAGDLNGADLAELMESENNMQGVAGASLPIIGNRRSIVFTASVKQAETLSSIFNRHKAGMSEWVCGATNKDQRREVLSRFDTGALQVVVNCAVLTEGFDNPGVEVIVMARPTKSRSLYAQMAGRSTRPLPGLVDGLPTAEERRAAIVSSPKPSCLIVDFVGNSGRHKLMSAGDILGGKVSDEAIERAIEKAKKSGRAVRMSELLDAEEENLRLEKIRQAEEERRRLEAARKSKLVANVQYTVKHVNPFDTLDIMPVKERGWDSGRTLSEKQKSVLLKQGINPDSLTYVQSRQLIAEIFRRWSNKLCTIGQAKVLKRYGYETKDLPYGKAREMLDALARNHWKKPIQKASTP